MQKPPLRKIWSSYFGLNWKSGLFLIVVFSVLRFVIVLKHEVQGGGNALFLLFLSMWVIPFVFLSAAGRKAIGFRKPEQWIRLLYSFIAGAVFCGIFYLISYLLYGDSVNNSFVYLSKAFALTPELLEANRYKWFCFSLLGGMTLSPVGEEFLYRGIIHGCFAGKYGENKSSVIDSLAFMIAHLPHFGIVCVAGKWSYPLFAGLLWMFFMFAVARLFFRCKQYSHSIWGAVFAHAGYNGIMMYFLFFHIL